MYVRTFVHAFQVELMYDCSYIHSEGIEKEKNNLKYVSPLAGDSTQ